MFHQTNKDEGLLGTRCFGDPNINQMCILSVEALRPIEGDCSDPLIKVEEAAF